MLDTRPMTHNELTQSLCRDGKPHNIWIGMTDDMKPQFCIVCKAWCNEYPPMSEMEDL
jgi:hypothetical protein